MRTAALLIVDVQNDFCPGCALAVAQGDQIVQQINNISSRFFADGRILASRDWHPENTEHFKKWPPHCVQGTRGAEFHPNLNLSGARVISKGFGAKDDGYSLFEGVYIRERDWPLSPEILLHGCDEIYICGLATDYCVKATALDARKLGFNTYLLLDACRAVNMRPDDGDKAIEEMIGAGVIITTTDEVIADNSPIHPD